MSEIVSDILTEQVVFPTMLRGLASVDTPLPEIKEPVRDQYQLHDTHPDKVSISKLRSEMSNKLTYMETNLKVKFPKWFRTFTDKACLTMQTTNPTRMLALCNEAAEAFRDHFKAYAPWLEKPFYFSMWGLTIGYLVARNLMVAIRGGGVALAKTAIHDFCSEAIIPPLIVQWANRVQDGISKKLFGIKSASFLGQAIHLFRPFTSMGFGATVMKHLDKLMVEWIPKFFSKLPHTMLSAINKLGGDIGGSIVTKLFIAKS